jgi:hypothetical protein
MVQPKAPGAIYQLHVLLLKINPPIWRRLHFDSEKRESRLASTSLPSAGDFPIPFEAGHNQPDLLLLIAACVTCFMRIFKLLIFFNLVFIPVLLLSFFGAAYIVRGQLQESAERQVVENSRVMMQTARASRLYTTKQISPLLDHEQSRVDKANNSVFQILDMQLPAAVQKAIDSIPHPKDKQVVENVRQQILDNVRQASRELPGSEFFPQSIPFYASTENFNYFRGQYPEYSYKEAALNPTNPRDRTVDWEADVGDRSFGESIPCQRESFWSIGRIGCWPALRRIFPVQRESAWKNWVWKSGWDTA